MNGDAIMVNEAFTVRFSARLFWRTKNVRETHYTCNNSYNLGIHARRQCLCHIPAAFFKMELPLLYFVIVGVEFSLGFISVLKDDTYGERN